MRSTGYSVKFPAMNIVFVLLEYSLFMAIAVDYAKEDDVFAVCSHRAGQLGRRRTPFNQRQAQRKDKLGMCIVLEKMATRTQTCTEGTAYVARRNQSWQAFEF